MGARVAPALVSRTAAGAVFRPFFGGLLLLLVCIPLCVLTMVAITFREAIAGQPGNLLQLASRLLSAGTMAGIALICYDLKVILPKKRRLRRTERFGCVPPGSITVALTAYNDEEAIGAAVRDFREHPLVRRVIVVSNNSKDRTMEVAQAADAIAVNESRQGYGACVYRCCAEALHYSDAEWIVLCEGDRTFRAFDLEKLAAYAPHAEIVNGTRIVEQLRQNHTQLSTFMYYGNFFVGKLLEAKHLGAGTFTDVGTTYKMLRRSALERLLPKLSPRINLEFNAYFMDTALAGHHSMVECPITFHPRVGESKGGNVNNWRALKVGIRMILGITIGWKSSADRLA